jgi:hypothetical protein
MSQTLTKELENLLIEDDDNHWHGAHIACQLDAPVVTLACGKHARWDEERNDSDLPKCEACIKTHYCPVCGEELIFA